MSSIIIKGFIFRDRLDALMKENKLNQTDLARATGISRKTINGYIRGRQSPDRHCLSVLARYFRVDESFLSGENMYRSVGEKFDAEIPEWQRRKTAFEVKMIEHFVEHYELKAYSGYDLEPLFDEIRDFTDFKVRQFKERGMKGE